MKKIRQIASVKSELIKKSRESALAGVQIFNNPSMCFKSEAYIVLMIIAWTYLFHAYFRSRKIEYKYFDMKGTRKRYHKTTKGAFKYWELERCLNSTESPIDKDTANNLRFLIGLRHEIEHQMTNRIDDFLSARFQACCLNYNEYLKKFFGDELGIENHLSFSLQFSSIDQEQKEMLIDQEGLPSHISSYILDFDQALSEEDYANPRYAYRILFIPKTANRKGQADKVIEFVRSDSPLAVGLNKEYAVIKETEKAKFLPSQVVRKMNDEGFVSFTMHNHTQLVKKFDARNPANGLGTMVADKHWHYYEKWIEVVRDELGKRGD
ncbi:MULTISPECIES: DUF3644 domain-containing protein [Acinetobacter calcoaceticus/baumannii complex]|uniref:DUF3644 domain-containing protein n=1 Tax=Acinetobacter calcoaceticus/baumannii complex TaxID=909768 RepID=UPI00070808B1|nr:DUF3644 domain-containing protein [Acinetobacter lactucae]KQE90194.1 hypothetical protein APB94_07540 [Acinetobacter lactucae]